ncbi:GntR family transcriptional regulator [Polaribacter sp. R77954]|uniref:GntR family transcriptional regulator n=1 Tax=Polaribacter sp. R77954 TaxID=3093870 RepID=UPI0037CAE60F
MVDLIKLDPNSVVPKYLQIIDAILYNISVGNIKIGDRIPSINKLSQDIYLSRDTVERAYSILKKRNVVVSVHGKGTYIVDTESISKPKILFFVDKLSPYKMKVYNSFLEKIDNSSRVDLHSYHCDETLFLELMEKYESSYDYFVIMPHFRTDDLTHISTTKKVTKVINKIPKQNLILLDNNSKIDGNFKEVFQDYENDIFSALNQGAKSISKYNKLTIVYPKTSFYPYPKGILDGFKKYCVQNNFKFEIIEEVTEQTSITSKSLFITLEDSDLVKVVNKIKSSKYKLGKDIGVVSYNDSPLKQLLGITVITTNFSSMGEHAANMILQNKKESVKIPINFIERASL